MSKGHKHKPKAKAKHPPKPKRGTCEGCLEPDYPVRSVVVQVDGKSRLNERLCRVCAAMLIVKLADHAPGWRRK